MNDELMTQLVYEMLAALELAKKTYDNITTKDFSLGKDKPARDAIDAAIKKANYILYGVDD